MSHKISIAFVSFNLTSGGAERVLINLANECSAHYNVKIITIENCSPFYTVNKNIDILSCNLNSSTKGIFPLKYVRYISTVYNLSKHLEKNNIDLVISFTTTVNVFSILASKFKNIPIIISERNNPIVDPPNLLWSTLRDQLYKKSNYLIVQTKANKKFFSKIISAEKIKVLSNPLSGDLTEKRKIPSDDRTKGVILSVGRLDKNKSQDILLKAFANIPNNNWKILFLGDGPEKSNYTMLAKELEIDRKVEFLGRKKNIADYYNDASVFVFTSKSEGFPNSLIEAQYFGLPCISTDCPHGPSEIIKNGYNGYLIEVDNVKQLEDKLRELTSNAQLRHTFSKNSVSNSKKYEIDLVKKGWFDLIESLGK